MRGDLHLEAERRRHRREERCSASHGTIYQKILLQLDATIRCDTV
jgi:hypothetical protein